jgi:hypothetical protein
MESWCPTGGTTFAPNLGVADEDPDSDLCVNCWARAEDHRPDAPAATRYVVIDPETGDELPWPPDFSKLPTFDRSNEIRSKRPS